MTTFDSDRNFQVVLRKFLKPHIIRNERHGTHDIWWHQFLCTQEDLFFPNLMWFGPKTQRSKWKLIKGKVKELEMLKNIRQIKSNRYNHSVKKRNGTGFRGFIPRAALVALIIFPKYLVQFSLSSLLINTAFLYCLYNLWFYTYSEKLSHLITGSWKACYMVLVLLSPYWF